MWRYTLREFRPAAFAFWKMSGHRDGTGRRKVWNSPELRMRGASQASYFRDTASLLEEDSPSFDEECVIVVSDVIRVAPLEMAASERGFQMST
jgi:hypothetical protein